jgi:hypothetical protein
VVALGRERAPFIESRAKRAGRRLAALACPVLLRAANALPNSAFRHRKASSISEILLMSRRDISHRGDQTAQAFVLLA